jgi:hypothetical protein
MDCLDIVNDVLTLGFNQPFYKQKETVWEVEIEPSLGYLLFLLGACVGNKTKSLRKFPEWLLSSSSHVKREFLSGYHGGDGGKLVVNYKFQQQQIKIYDLPMRTYNTSEIYDSHLEYFQKLGQLYTDFGIKWIIHKYATKYEDRTQFRMHFSTTHENINNYINIITHRYAYNKRVNSRIPIEYLKCRMNGVWFKYEKFTKCFQLQNHVTTFVESIEEIDPEPVYDFTTISENHSFIANSFVSHNCLPSRMTVGQLFETLLGKVGAMDAEFQDGTPFQNLDLENIMNKMETYGFQRMGNETMYNGMTGEQMACQVFIGPTYYQRLKHMVVDKVHSRNKGAVQVLVRQPNEGRSAQGGLRLGEMNFCLSQMIKIWLVIYFK